MSRWQRPLRIEPLECRRLLSATAGPVSLAGLAGRHSAGNPDTALECELRDLPARVGNGLVDVPSVHSSGNLARQEIEFGSGKTAAEANGPDGGSGDDSEDDDRLDDDEPEDDEPEDDEPEDDEPDDDEPEDDEPDDDEPEDDEPDDDEPEDDEPENDEPEDDDRLDGDESQDVEAAGAAVDFNAELQAFLAEANAAMDGDGHSHEGNADAARRPPIEAGEDAPPAVHPVLVAGASAGAVATGESGLDRLAASTKPDDSDLNDRDVLPTDLETPLPFGEKAGRQPGILHP